MNTHTSIYTPIFIATLLLASLVWATTVSAASRDSVRGGNTTTTIPTTNTTSSSPSPLPGFPSASGGISNSTTGTVQSGGNAGGQVETGDESVEVYVVNEGPINNNTTVTHTGDEAAEAPASDADPEAPCDARVTRCSQGTRNR